MSHVDPHAPLSPREAMQAFDCALGRPPFSCSEKVMISAAQLRDSIRRNCQRLNDLQGMKCIVTDLPVIATSLPLGFSTSPNGFEDAKPLVLILCEALAVVASILKYPLQDFLAATRAAFPMCRETVALHRACGAIDLATLRHFLGVPQPVPGQQDKATGKKPSVGKKNPSAASVPAPPTTEIRQPSPVAPEVIGELCLAALDAEGRKILLKQLDSAAKFSAVVGDDMKLASVVLSIYGPLLVPVLKPVALIPCMGMETAEAFVTLLDKHALSLSVLVDHDAASNMFSSGEWCQSGIAVQILCEICRGDVLNPETSTEPFGLLVAVVLWLRAACSSDGSPAAMTSDNCLRLLHIVLLLANTIGARYQQLGPQRWLIPLSTALDLLFQLLGHSNEAVASAALSKHTTAVLGGLIVPLVSETLGQGCAAPRQAMSSKGGERKKAAAATKGQRSAAGELPVSQSIPPLDVLGPQGVVSSLLSIAAKWGSRCDDATSKHLSTLVDMVLPWASTSVSPKKELLEALSTFLVSTRAACYACKTEDGRVVVSAIVRAPCRYAVDLVSQVLHTQDDNSFKSTVFAVLDAVCRVHLSSPSPIEGSLLRSALISLGSSGHTQGELSDVLVAFCRQAQTAMYQTMLIDIDSFLPADSVEEGSDLSGAIAKVKAAACAAREMLNELERKSVADEQAKREALIAQARKLAEDGVKKRAEQEAALDAMRKDYAVMCARRESLSLEAKRRIEASCKAREMSESSMKGKVEANLEAMRAAARQAKKNREATLRASVSAYRERIAHARNVTEFLISLGIPASRAYAVPRELQSRLTILSPQEVLEYIVHGNAELPPDLPTSIARSEAEQKPTISFSDDLEHAACTSTKMSHNFWDLVMSDVTNDQENEQHPADHTQSDASVQNFSFHFRVAPLLDLFSYAPADGNESLEGSKCSRLSLPVRHVKHVLEEPCSTAIEKGGDSSIETWCSYCGFDDALHMVFSAQQKNLVRVENGMVVLTPLGHAYHEAFWNPSRSLNAALVRKREAAQMSLQQAAENTTLPCPEDDEFSEGENDIDWFADELM